MMGVWFALVVVLVEVSEGIDGEFGSVDADEMGFELVAVAMMVLAVDKDGVKTSRPGSIS